MVNLIYLQDATEPRFDFTFGCVPHNYILLVLDLYLTLEILNARLHQRKSKSKGVGENTNKKGQPDDLSDCPVRGKKREFSA
jgi:hypothetical protein